MKNEAKVYNTLSVAEDGDKNQKWNYFLLSCCIVASLASFSFGYNIGVTNLPTPKIKEFYARQYFSEYYKEKAQLDLQTTDKTDMNQAGSDELFKDGNSEDKPDEDIKKRSNNVTAEVQPQADKALELKAQAEIIETRNTMLWTLTTTLFVIGGIIGAFTSKFAAEGFGRKKSIVFHYSFGIVAAVLTIIAPYVHSPECVMIGRFLFGVQGGMTCGLVPGYLNEISPNKLRGASGVILQLFITVGILVSQILGIRQLLGTDGLWHVLLSLSAIPSFIGGILLLLVFPDSPSSLINRDRDEDAARRALEKLRQSKDVSGEIDAIKAESRESKSDHSLTISELFTTRELKWPLITSIVLQLTQQLCGINAIFFYSESIFKSANIQDDYIQYAVLATGGINVLATIVALPLIDKLGRKPLLVYPLIFIIFDFIALTFFLAFKTYSEALSYLSIICIVLFIVSFAVGLGPIPFVYVAECFRSEARSTALAIAMFTNWMANLVLTLCFPYMAKLLGDYTFLVFTVICAVAVVVIIKKVPETKGRSADEIMAQFDNRAALEDASGKLISNTNV